MAFATGVHPRRRRYHIPDFWVLTVVISSCVIVTISSSQRRRVEAVGRPAQGLQIPTCLKRPDLGNALMDDCSRMFKMLSQIRPLGKENCEAKLLPLLS